jgi:PAS domain-containing protein
MGFCNCASGRAEEALRESEQRFRDYAETASDWFWETGPDHRVTHISEHINAVGIVPSRLTGVARWDIANVESEPEKWRLHRAMHDAHRAFRDFVYRALSASGSPVYVRLFKAFLGMGTFNLPFDRGSSRGTSVSFRQ